MSWIRASSLVAALTAGLVAPFAAAAGPASSNDAAGAETLFEEARKLMAAGDYATACPKLAESYRLDPGTGTLTALALCHEQQGKTATAWAEFIDVITQAQHARRADREKFARHHVAALEPTLSRLTITVAPEASRASDFQVHRDDVALGSASWGVAVPVDPGEHVVTATATGKKPWSTRVTVAAGSQPRSITVPALDDADEPVPVIETPPMVAPEPAPEATAVIAPVVRSSQRTVGIVVGGAGIAALGLGAYFGVQALSKSHDAKALCSSAMCGQAQGVQLNDDAKTNARIADVTLGAGLVALGVGAYLVLSAPSDPPAAGALRITPMVELAGRGGGGAILRTTW